MAVKKKPIDHERIRSVPAEGFSWIDRRFVREGFIEPLAPQAILLYRFPVSTTAISVGVLLSTRARWL